MTSHESNYCNIWKVRPRAYFPREDLVHCFNTFNGIQHFSSRHSDSYKSRQLCTVALVHNVAATSQTQVDGAHLALYPGRQTDRSVSLLLLMGVLQLV